MTVLLSDFLKVREAIGKNPFASRNFSQQKGFNLGYLRYRLIRPWVKWRYNKYQKNHPNEPWLCPDAISALKELLPNSKLGLEYGSGRSTTFFAPYFDKYISIEHHKEWYVKVEEKIRNLSNVEYHLIPAEQEAQQQHLSSEDQAFLTEEQYPIPDQHFQKYSNRILTYDDESFDFILVDGRARKTCALNAIPKLKSGGLLVLDNSERKRYISVHEALNDWPKIETTTGLTDTTIWRKP